MPYMFVAWQVEILVEYIQHSIPSHFPMRFFVAIMPHTCQHDGWVLLFRKYRLHRSCMYNLCATKRAARDSGSWHEFPLSIFTIPMSCIPRIVSLDKRNYLTVTCDIDLCPRRLAMYFNERCNRNINIDQVKSFKKLLTYINKIDNYA